MSIESVAQEFVERQARAQELAYSGAVARTDWPGRYFVRSQSGDGGYVVDLIARTCDCAANRQRGYDCKHILAAQIAYAHWQEDVAAYRARVNARIAADKAPF